MKLIKAFNVIVASTEDIVVERKIVREVCSGVNEGLLPNPLGISFSVKGWENIFPTAGTPRDIIDRLINDCDILVCILHKKVGIISDIMGSFALERFLSVYDLWRSLKKPHIMFYFKGVKISSLKDLKNPQLIKVLELKENIENDNLLISEEFSAPHEFCEKVHNNLEIWIREIVKTGGNGKK
jgi:hypothetical protein